MSYTSFVRSGTGSPLVGEMTADQFGASLIAAMQALSTPLKPFPLPKDEISQLEKILKNLRERGLNTQGALATAFMAYVSFPLDVPGGEEDRVKILKRINADLNAVPVKALPADIAAGWALTNTLSSTDLGKKVGQLLMDENQARVNTKGSASPVGSPSVGGTGTKRKATRGRTGGSPGKGPAAAAGRRGSVSPAAARAGAGSVSPAGRKGSLSPTARARKAAAAKRARAAAAAAVAAAAAPVAARRVAPKKK